jgi:hypothetical protein
VRKTKRPKRAAAGRGKPQKSTPGPKPSITLAVVKRVSSRFARGITLKLALAAENNSKINEETWKKALAAHPEFYPHYEGAKGKFLAESMEKLAAAKDLKFLCWLLERRHSDLFAKPSDISVSVTNQVNVSTDTKPLTDAQLESIARRGSESAVGAKKDQA